MEQIFWKDWKYEAQWWIYFRNLDIPKFMKKIEDQWDEVVWIEVTSDSNNLQFIIRKK